MNDGLLETQLIVPSLNTEGTITATMNCDEDLTLELKSNIKLPETNTVQKITLKYGVLFFFIKNFYLLIYV